MLHAIAAQQGDPAWLPDDGFAIPALELDDEEWQTTLNGLLLWIRTARASGYGAYLGRPWLPSGADFAKSALFERIRSGLAPLPEPPPLGHSCPWYALVEDEGPHWTTVHIEGDKAIVFQTPYEILERRGETSFLLKDGGHDTSYRFTLRFDPEWRHPSARLGDGGWFIQNATFEKA